MANCQYLYNAKGWLSCIKFMITPITKNRIINLGLLLSFLICYLEWAGGNSGFLFQFEYSVFSTNANQNTFAHPLIFIPLLGQLLLLISVFYPNKRLTLFGIILLSVLVLVILLVGVLSFNLKIILSTIPFITISILFIENYRKQKSLKTKTE